MKLLSCELHHWRFISCSHSEIRYYNTLNSAMSHPWSRKQLACRQVRPKYVPNKTTTYLRTTTRHYNKKENLILWI